MKYYTKCVYIYINRYYIINIHKPYWPYFIYLDQPTLAIVNVDLPVDLPHQDPPPAGSANPRDAKTRKLMPQDSLQNQLSAANLSVMYTVQYKSLYLYSLYTYMGMYAMYAYTAYCILYIYICRIMYM